MKKIGEKLLQKSILSRKEIDFILKSKKIKLVKITHLYIKVKINEFINFKFICIFSYLLFIIKYDGSLKI